MRGLLSIIVLGLGLALPAAAQDERRIDLRGQIQAALELVRDPARFHRGNAEALLSRGYEQLFGIDPARLDLEELDRDPEGLNRLVFELVLAIDDRTAAIDREQGGLSEAAGAAKRRVLRGLRYLREQLLLRAHRAHPDRLYAGGRPAFAQLPPTAPGLDRYHWTVAPGHFQRRFQASELPRTFFILNEGDMTLSAAIARSSSEDNMFSHYSVGWVSDREVQIKGKTWPAGSLLTIEALIERGVVIEPLPYHWKEALNGWSAREAVFFLRDPAQQAALDKAADAFFTRANQAFSAGKPLGYDFSMGTGLSGAVEGRPAPGPLEMSKYFCSGVAEAIGHAAGVELFTHPSRLEPGSNSRALFVRWGLDPDRPLPSPGDGDVSTALVRVAEGVNLDRLEVTHQRHAILERVFAWIDRDGYQVRSPKAFQGGTELITKLNDKVEGTAFDFGLVPNGITPEIMQSLVPIQFTAQAYLKRLKQREEEFRREHGRSLTPAEMAAYLEQIRDEVDVDAWFVRGAAGRYALEATRPFPWSKPASTTLLVEQQAGGFRVVREVRRGGLLIARGVGTGVQEGKKLRVSFAAREGEHPERLTYELERDGRIAARLSLTRSERGARAETPARE